MSKYAALLDDMMKAIVAEDTAPACAMLCDKEDFPAASQLAVYSEGYQIRLGEAVESAYPALAHYLGKPAMTTLVKGYIAAHPSRNFNLDKYPTGFAAYVARHNDDSFARDLAVLEGAIHDVYQREETPAIAASWAQSQTLATLAIAKLKPREAAELLEFTTQVNDYVTAFRTEKNPSKPAAEKSWVLVLRHKHQVQRLALSESEYRLLSLLQEGLTLVEALEDPRFAPFTADEHFAIALQGWFVRWIEQGVLRQPDE